MNTKRIILSTAVGILAFGVGFLGVTVTAVAAESLSSLLPKGEVADTKEGIIEQIEFEPLVERVAEPMTDVETETVADNAADADTMYLDGTYYLDEENTPKEFRDIVHVEIETHDYEKMDENGEPGLPIPPKGEIKTKKRLKFSRIAINGRMVAFQTETVNGISYRFLGTYVATDHCDEEIDLTGHLILIKDGKWAAAMKAEFREFCGC